MARAATTSDPFNAVAEPRRRQILSYLAHQERPVGHIAKCLRLGQPSVSKHLRVLKKVGLVSARRNGRQIFYKTNPELIQVFYEWAKAFKNLWSRQSSSVRSEAASTRRPRQQRGRQKPCCAWPVE
jgi:DNA-binding transcriptional ArsR family regulator